MICANHGRYANAQNLLSQCERLLLTRKEAAQIIDLMEVTVRERWYDVARREGVTERDCQRIGGAFAAEGFRLPLQASA